MDTAKGSQGPSSSRCHSVRRLRPGNRSELTLSSDFENKFVCGEIMSYDDLKEYGTEAQVKANGKQRQQGKTCKSSWLCRIQSDYADNPDEVQDGDICYWKCGQ
jgi:obg-like ATPase 1